MKRIKNLVGISLCFVVFIAAGGSFLFAAEVKFPTKPIILVAPGTLGGGADVQSRLIQAVIERKNMFKEPVVVLNKGGKAGAQETFIFLEGKKGDPHYWSPCQLQVFTFALFGASYNPLELTPFSLFVFDPEVVVVRQDSPYKTFGDLVSAAKDKPNVLTVANTVIGAADHMAWLMLEKATGTKFRYVAFAGGGEVHKQILGGQFDCAAGNPSDFMGSLEAKLLRGLVVTSDKRSSAPAIADVPTLKEAGYSGSYAVPRGFFGPPGVKPEYVKIINNTLKTVLEDAEFQEQYVKRMGAVPAFMDQGEFKRYLRGMYPEYVQYLKDSGVLKEVPPRLDPKNMKW